MAAELCKATLITDHIRHASDKCDHIPHMCGECNTNVTRI